MGYGMYDFTPDYKWADDILLERGNGLYTGCYDCDGNPVYTGDVVEVFNDTGKPRQVSHKAKVALVSDGGLGLVDLEDEEAEPAEVDEELEAAWDELDAKMAVADEKDAEALYRDFMIQHHITTDPDNDGMPERTKEGLVCTTDGHWGITGMGERLNLRILTPVRHRSPYDMAQVAARLVDGYLSNEEDENGDSVFYGDILRMHREDGSTYEGPLVFDPLLATYVEGWREGDYLYNESYRINGTIIRKNPNRHEPTPEQIVPEDQREDNM